MFRASDPQRLRDLKKNSFVEKNAKVWNALPKSLRAAAAAPITTIAFKRLLDAVLSGTEDIAHLGGYARLSSSNFLWDTIK